MVLLFSSNAFRRGRLPLVPSRSLNRSFSSASSRLASKDHKSSNSEQKPENPQNESKPNSQNKSPTPNDTNTKSVSEADAELRERLEKMSGEGGSAGIEYEDGKPNAMKRSVRNNMFRLI
ncbi:uncharacterized protein N7498_008394 [Penicillium cinerascens]|uniref:Uncharacterized protein n=1 Tax=Penicillium cinerascens TaxID=70096 RepID=A0A9W9JIK2_9EURO|nr:uncharacterized protein N7498_008394 [Penicillium cinerascens]KAJ5194956.1 hypothetical protein N7498_008394 [Penicillium cinerascens]